LQFEQKSVLKVFVNKAHNYELKMKKIKRTTIIISFFLITNNVQAQTLISNLSPAEYYDFWIGEWDLTWSKSDESIGKGENSIFKTLNNFVLKENFNVTDDESMNGFKGESWSVFNSNNGTWYQTWVDNQGSYLDFIGEIDGEKRIFKREVQKPDGSIIYQRMVFYDIQPNSFTWDWENSTDNGETWNLLWRINYKRKGVN
jgi:hypothetical protein